jgi:hypothetical protein
MLVLLLQAERQSGALEPNKVKGKVCFVLKKFVEMKFVLWKKLSLEH